MRWRLEGDEAGPPALFSGFDDEVVERRPGKGRFAGMEFLHVRARTIVNTLPGPSRLPFRHTINGWARRQRTGPRRNGPGTAHT